MLLFVMSLFLTFSIQAEEPSQSIIHAQCACEILDEAGHGIALSDLGAPIPTLLGANDVVGSAPLKPGYEQKNCQADESGNLSTDCLLPVMRAQKYALNNCRERARALFPNEQTGFMRGKLVPGSCEYDLE